MSSAPQAGGQVNQAAPRLDIRGFDFGAAAVFDAQIIQPRVAFDDGLQHLQLLAEWGLGFSRFEQDQAVLSIATAEPVDQSCGNRVLGCMIRSLQDHFARFRSMSLDLPERILAWHRERLRILETLKRGDGQLAERLVHEHFDHAGRLLLESLLTHPQRGKEARVQKEDQVYEEIDDNEEFGNDYLLEHLVHAHQRPALSGTKGARTTNLRHEVHRHRPMD